MPETAKTEKRAELEKKVVREADTDADDDDDAVADESKKLIDIASDTETAAAAAKTNKTVSSKPVGKGSKNKK